MKDKDRDVYGCARRQKGAEGVDVQYTRGQSQDLRDVTARIRAIELFNPDGLLPPVPFVSPPTLSPTCPFPVCPTERSPFTRRPRILRPACCLCPSSPRFDLSFIRRSVLFLSCLSRPYSPSPVLSLSSSAATPACLPSPFGLLSRRPCSRAVPLYLPPPSPIVPSSLKAV